MDYFKTAVELDRTIRCRVYLATAYMSQYIAAAESPENVQLANEAKEEFQGSGENPADTTALASLASLNYHQAQGMPDLDQKLKKLERPRNGTSS